MGGEQGESEEEAVRLHKWIEGEKKEAWMGEHHRGERAVRPH